MENEYARAAVGVTAILATVYMLRALMKPLPKLVARVIVPDLPQMKEFCHATVSDDLVMISGCIGTDGKAMKLVEGGLYAETTAALTALLRIMVSCGTETSLLKVNVYLKDNNAERFAEMNRAYSQFFIDVGLQVPARITVGCGELALGAQVEMDAMARIITP